MMDLAGNEAFVQALLEHTAEIEIGVNDVLAREVGDLKENRRAPALLPCTGNGDG